MEKVSCIYETGYVLLVTLRYLIYFSFCSRFWPSKFRGAESPLSPPLLPANESPMDGSIWTTLAIVAILGLPECITNIRCKRGTYRNLQNHFTSTTTFHGKAVRKLHIIK